MGFENWIDCTNYWSPLSTLYVRHCALEHTEPLDCECTVLSWKLMAAEELGPSARITAVETFFRRLVSEGEQILNDLSEAAAKSGDASIVHAGESANAMPRTELADTSSSLQTVHTRVQELEGELNGVRKCLDDLENAHFDLASRSFAALRIHAANSTEEVLNTIRELLLNFAGVGQFVLYVVDEEQQRLFAVLEEDCDISQAEDWPLDDGVGARLKRVGRAWNTSDAVIDLHGEICALPLYSRGRLVGAARLRAFLPQKHAFTDSDRELLALLSEHGGIGLETAWIRANTHRVILRRQEVEELVKA